MRINRMANPQDTSTLVQRRFWSLICLIFLLAVTSSAFAVKLTSTPILVGQQNEAVQTRVATDARSLEALLERHLLLLEVIGKAPDVSNVVMGYARNKEIVSQYLENGHQPDDLSWVAVYDILGAEIAIHAPKPDIRALFDTTEIEALVEDITGMAPTALHHVVLQEQGAHTYVLLTAPILHAGYVEGAVVATFEIDRATVFPESEIVQSIRMVHTSDLDAGHVPLAEGAVSAALEKVDLAIVMEPDQDSVRAAERRLFTNTVAAIATVLVIAFAVFAAAGRAALVEPHQRLARQKKDLAELAAVAERANDAIIVTDIRGIVTWTNPAFEQLSGFTMQEIHGQKPGDVLQGPETDPEHIALMRKALLNLEPVKLELLNYRKDGSSYWVSIGISPLSNEHGEGYGFVSISHDITQERAQRDAIVQAKQEIEYQALHDPLTGLPNRRALNLALQDRKATDPDDATIVRIDLDHFKYVNDTLGHEAGDFVLCSVADILRDETKEGDLPVRVGGDEFVILLGVGNTSAVGETVAQRMLERIRQPTSFEGKTVRVGASFGIASTHDGLLPIDSLTIGADAALYEAKDMGRDRVRLYTPALHDTVIGRRTLALEIRRAIANREFVPYFQPQFDAQTHDIVGVETLARWHSPTLGVMHPGQFLPIAEQLSVVDDMDAIIFDKAVAEISNLQRTGITIPKVSFNVTAQRIQNPKVFDLLESLPEGAPRIGFEVLESVLVEEQSDLFSFSLDRIRDTGVCIEIDDFGSGHASIIGLMHLRPDIMKIDQRLVMPILESEDARALLRQIIGMADILGLKVTAEGVETMAHAEVLAEMGCHTLQGYAFARPQPIEGLKALIEGRDPSISPRNKRA
ncbi:Bacteriophytochrome cph2 [Tritonibacter multivorans]|uniref:Bacteriophytochrome cph2 n=2 Tax=Tritonibacter multivorans TaxID=928856 RepID=A0A0P1GNV7_9RHOB|nr:GGDEF domain-containing phosphodiesterase [Tritonibacter multivorans]MDA7422517.1 EAL domain-containing protein [Tritonibacter multivorans]CUH76307.1 Bacteriophytochrome cph2 [Tritonibacter multivorans]SFD40277.1 PAS domain S-box-containing protein/diguanylate cyclase (GGDEF) domain-containing protein [Tritonibacter multivorans]